LIARKADEFLNNNLLEVFVHGRYLDSFWTLVENKGIDLKLQEGDLEVLSKVRSDYLTFSYYQSLMIDHREIPEEVAPNSYMKYGQKNNPHLEASEWSWQIDPLGFRNILNKMFARYNFTIFTV